MTGHEIIELLRSVLSLISMISMIVWLLANFTFVRRRLLFCPQKHMWAIMRVCANVFFELRPLFLVVCVFFSATDPDLLSRAVYAVWFLVTFRTREDNDRWKRRRRKTLERVQRLGSRLVVVPAPAR